MITDYAGGWWQKMVRWAGLGCRLKWELQVRHGRGSGRGVWKGVGGNGGGEAWMMDSRREGESSGTWRGEREARW
ncbi:hypothetical protein Pmani_037756 [Petrolisthes manimaculis]|uniref:Uncharacterized protein n=1 Tax=Petrolisthes manimaculis TaxID=1843537 RepID=A0AAE1TN01_9EUCA|nr:hypothetical protein Pmani_037756 [Petrolisthes manimaculis]